MNRAELIETVSNATGLMRSEVSAVFEAILKAIETEVTEGRTVELRKFGTFKSAKRAARKTINPRTGVTIHIDERVVPIFKPSPRLRDAVGNGKS